MVTKSVSPVKKTTRRKAAAAAPELTNSAAMECWNLLRQR